MSDHSGDHSHAAEHGGHAPHQAAKGSPLRLMILLALLAALLGGGYYELYVARPGVDNADKKLLAFAESHIAKSIKSRDPKNTKQAADALDAKEAQLDGTDVREVFSMSPTRTEEKDDYTVEYYCWWGHLLPYKHYISVLYLGPKDQRHYYAHYVNQPPPADSLPGYVNPESANMAAAGEVGAVSPPTGVGGMGGMGGGPPGMGGGMPGMGGMGGGMPGMGGGKGGPPGMGGGKGGKGGRPAKGATKGEGEKGAEVKTGEEGAEKKGAAEGTEEKPAEPAKTEEKPAEEKPAEAKPEEEKPAEEKPETEKPAEAAAEEKPAEK